MGVFDYRVPDVLKISSGDLVEIPLKNSSELAIVTLLTDTSEEEVRDISRVVMHAFLSEASIHRLTRIASAIVQSPASILKATFQGFREQIEPLSVEKSSPLSEPESEVWKAIKTKLSPDTPLFLSLGFSQSLSVALWMKASTNKQLLIIAPFENQVTAASGQPGLEHAAILHGTIKDKQRAQIIEGWRNGDIRTLISTRQGSLLPAKELGGIICLDATNTEHQNTKRNPRFDARLATELLAKEHACPLLLTGHVPRSRDILSKTQTVFPSFAPFSVISLKAEEQKTGKILITEALKIGITEALQNKKSVLCSFNRKGFAKRLQCRSCQYIPTCGTCGSIPVVRKHDLRCPVCHTEMWRPNNCLSCGELRLTIKGIGNKSIANDLAALFPEAKIALIDKDQEQIEEADIYLVTEYYFSNRFTKDEPSFGFIAELAADLELTTGKEDAGEALMQKLYRLGHIAREHAAPCIVQTWLPDMVKKMQTPKVFLQEELSVRKKYSLFPHREIFTVESRGKPVTNEDRAILDILKQVPSARVLQTSAKYTITSTTKSKHRVEEELQKLTDMLTITPTRTTYES